MWKDFFYFSKGERKAIVFLLGMIVTIIGVWLVSPYLIEESSKETGQESFEEMERFLAGIQTIEHKRNASFKKKEVVKKFLTYGSLSIQRHVCRRFNLNFCS